MKTTSSPIARAIDELVTEREHLAARLTKVDAAIATMRELFHLPGERLAAKARIKHDPDPDQKRSTKGDTVKDAIRAALKAGPLTTIDLAARLRIKKAKAGYHVKQLQTDGVVTFLGSGRATTVALTGTSAKEAP